ncbi:hypothetical protein MHTCC0001_14420 [Flavobacteriaceae bacterium MHTCC 0001]
MNDNNSEALKEQIKSIDTDGNISYYRAATRIENAINDFVTNNKNEACTD